MLPFLPSCTTTLKRALHAWVMLALFTSLSAMGLRGAEPAIVALHGLEAAEVRQQGFTLPSAMKVHIYARGAAVRSLGRLGSESPFFAYGWILNAATREVVWQMDGANTKRDWDYRVADQYLDLPAGSYEAYFANHGFGRSLLFAQWSQNIDRRSLQSHRDRPHGFLAALGADESSLLQHWHEEVGNYGMEIYLPSGDAPKVTSFEAPLHWKNVVATLRATGDSGRWEQSFHLSRPTSLHIYAEGEGSGRQMHDFGWILNARTRARVWEMTMDKSQYAGGARKNRRQVETLLLPAGDYEAAFVTDDSHSPADWNAAPPCDPGLYGLTLSVPLDSELSSVSLTKPLAWPMLAELVRVGDSQDRSVPLGISHAQEMVQHLAE
jgi:hypothetical protein